MTIYKKTNFDQENRVLLLPTGVLTLLMLIIFTAALRWMLPKDVDLYFLLTMAVIPLRFSEYVQDIPGGSLAQWSSLLTYVFVHGSLSHLIFNAASLMAFGGALEKRIGTFRFLLFFFICGALAAASFILVHPHLYAPMIGASGAIAGLLGGLIRIFFSVSEDKKENNLNFTLLHTPLLPLGAAVRDRRILAVSLAFFLFNIATLFGIQDV
ncbi:MAG: rhomboid family intramembrane serine protease, partial [Hyphomicrobium sp.]